jgi:hypothetical protein
MNSKRAVTNIISLLLVILITFAIASAMYFWLTRIQIESQEVGTQYHEQTLSSIITEVKVVDEPLYNTLSEDSPCIPTSIKMLIQNTGAKKVGIDNSSEILISDSNNNVLCLSTFEGTCTNKESGIFAAIQNDNANSSIIHSTDGVTWTSRDDNMGTSEILSSAEYNDTIYFGGKSVLADVSTVGARVFKSCDFTSWNNDNDLPTARNVFDLIVFNGNLYAATGSDPGDGNGKVFKRESNQTWTEVYDSGSDEIRDLVIFNDQIYAGTFGAGKLVKTSDGETWTVSHPSLGNITKLEVYENKDGIKIYAGLDGGEVWSSSDGIDFGSRRDLDTSDDAITSFQIFNSDLFVGTNKSGSASIYRYSYNLDGWGQVYKAESANQNDSINGFTIFNDKLFAAMFSTSGGVILTSTNGLSWQKAYEAEGLGFSNIANYSYCAQNKVECMQGCGSDMVAGETRLIELKLSNTECDLAVYGTGSKYDFRINLGSEASVSGRFDKDIVEVSNENSLCEYTYPFCNGVCTNGGACAITFGHECECMAAEVCGGLPPDWSCSIGTCDTGTCTSNLDTGICECI